MLLGALLGVTRLLEAIRRSGIKTKFYQASSSEMFGDAPPPQDERTAFRPRSPYAAAKVYAYWMVVTYRNAYNLFASNGILFNHESPRRSANFVSMKIIKSAIAIKKGKASELKLGSLDAARDWGHAYDYVRAMYLMMHHKEPSDFVIATGESHSVRDICQYVFKKLRLNYNNYVALDEKHQRPEELLSLRGDATKANNIRSWKPQYTFESMLDEMIAAEVAKSRKK